MTNIGFRKYAYMVFGDDGALKRVVELDGDKDYYYSMMNGNEVWFNHNGGKSRTDGLLVPHNNFGVGLAFSYHKTDDEEKFVISTVKTDSDKPSEQNEISYKYLKSLTVNLKSNYVYFENNDISEKEIDFVGINNKKGTFTIRQFDDLKNQQTIKLMCNDGSYFEGIVISDNMYIGVHYGRGEYVYVGYVDADAKYNGEGYLMDPNDGEIMRQGLWNNNNLSSTKDIKANIDSKYPIDKTAVLTINKNVLNKDTVKLSPSVKFDFPNVNLK